MKRFGILVFALLLLPSFAMAGTISLGLQGGSSWYMAVPRYEDSLPFRSSVTGEGSLTAGYAGEKFGLSLLFTGKYVSSSPVYDGKCNRTFYGFGGGLHFQYQFTHHWGMFLDVAMLYNRYLVHQAFISYQGKVGPTFLLLDTRMINLTLSLPIGLEVRQEVFGMTLGLLLTMDYDVLWRQ